MRNRAALLVNPLDHTHLIAIEESGPPDGPGVLSASVSFNGGISWRESWPLALEPWWAAIARPVLAMDAGGTLHLAALARGKSRQRALLVAYQSVDGGVRWSRPVIVLETPNECSYSIATDLSARSSFRGNVYLAADAGDSLCFSRSAGGENWSADPAGARAPQVDLCYCPELLVDSQGSVHIVWMNGADGRRIMTSVSTDGGRTFNVPVVVAGGITPVCDELLETLPATCFSDDGVAICAWADGREGESRIYCRRSTDGGLTWEGPPSGAPMFREAQAGQNDFHPRLRVTAKGEICCAFYEYGPKSPEGEPMVNLMMTVSYDAGLTFTGRMVLSARPWDPAGETPIPE